MIRKLPIIVATAIIVGCLGAYVYAGCHTVTVRKPPVVAYTPVYQPYYYSVGQNLQLRAAIEIAKEELRAEMRASQQVSEAGPEQLPLTAEVDRWALVKANCAGCHTTNEAAKNHVDMTDLSALTCEQKLACIAAVLDGEMPKGKKLDPQSLGNLLGEFSGAQTAHQP